jgi:integrase
LLKVKNVDLVKGIIHVPGEISKNKKFRMLPVADAFLGELREYLHGKNPEWYLCSSGFKPGPTYIFPTRIAERFREIALKLSLPDTVYFYSLKDTCADRLVEGGFSVKTIRDLFGHSSIAITDEYLRSFNVQAFDQLRKEFPPFITNRRVPALKIV